MARTYTKAEKQAFFGFLWFGGGLLVTCLTYSLASNGGGGTYAVAWGPVVFGGIKMMRGLLGLAAGDSEVDVDSSPETVPADRTHCPSCRRQVAAKVNYCPTCGRYMLA